MASHLSSCKSGCIRAGEGSNSFSCKTRRNLVTHLGSIVCTHGSNVTRDISKEVEKIDEEINEYMAKMQTITSDY